MRKIPKLARMFHRPSVAAAAHTPHHDAISPPSPRTLVQGAGWTGRSLCLPGILLLFVLMSGCSTTPTRPMPAEPASQSHGDATAGYQRLPAPLVIYRDPDPQASASPRLSESDPRHLRWAQSVARGPTGSMRSALAYPYLLSLRGDRERAMEWLSHVRVRFPDQHGSYWTEGWMHMNLNDPAAALVAWQRAEDLHGGRPFWVPYSKAVAFIALHDETAALAWWKVAQTSFPDRYATAQSVRANFAHWRSSEKLLLERLLLLAFPTQS